MGYMNLGNMLIQPGKDLNQRRNIGNVGAGSQNQSFNKKLSETRHNIQTNSLEKDYEPMTKSVKDNKRRQRQDLKTKDQPSTNNEIEVKKDNKPSNVDKASKEVNPSVEETKLDQKESELSEEVETDQVDEQILMLVSQTLNIPIEEVTHLLSQLGIEAQDLMSQENFGLFIAEALGKGNMEVLLTENSDLSMVTQLFEDLTKLKEAVSIDESLSSTVGNLQEQTSQLVEHEMVQAPQTMQTGMNTLSEANIPSEVNDGKENLVEESKPQLSFLSEDEMSTQGTGEQIPVHHFTSSQAVQNFQTGNGTVMQTITSKVSGSGEAFIEHIDFKVIGQTKELSVQLSPKELGQLNIKIVEYNGSLVAEIKVDNEKAKDFILNEIHLLKEKLEGEGLKISDVKVDIRQDQRQSQMEQEKQKSSKRIQEIISKHLNEEEEEEDEGSASVLTESEVDYMV